MTKTFVRRALLGATLAALVGGATAIAQPGWGPGYGPGMMGDGYGPGMMGGGGYGPGMMGGWGGYGPGMRGWGNGPAGDTWDAGHFLGSLKAALGITQAQEPAWDRYAQAFNSFSDQMQALRQGMYESMADGSWAQHRAFMQQAWQSRQQALAMMRDATGQLMQALDPQQREKAQDALASIGCGYGYGYGPGRRSGGYGPGGMGGYGAGPR